MSFLKNLEILQDPKPKQSCKNSKDLKYKPNKEKLKISKYKIKNLCNIIIFNK